MSGREAAEAARTTAAFVAALRAAGTALREVPGKLEGARVHDFAFGKLFEAREVRDAYHQRLPETENDIAEACEVLDHFVGGLTGGHAIGTRAGAVPSGPSVPSEPSGSSARSALSARSAPSGLAAELPSPRRWTADTFPWCRLLPEPEASVEP